MFPTPDPNYDPKLTPFQQIIKNLNDRNNSQPAIGNKIVTDTLIGVNNALTPPLVGAVQPVITGAGNVITAGGNALKYGAVIVGAIVLIKIMK